MDEFRLERRGKFLTGRGINHWTSCPGTRWSVHHLPSFSRHELSFGNFAVAQQDPRAGLWYRRSEWSFLAVRSIHPIPPKPRGAGQHPLNKGKLP